MDKDAVKEELRDINADNVLATVLFYLGDGEFTSDPDKLQRGFVALENKEEYRRLLKEFLFVRIFPFPYSPYLERALQRLVECKLLWFTPGFCQYQVPLTARTIIEKEIMLKFNGEQQERLRKMAFELKAFLE